jgi:hypothetical protein
LLPWCIRVFLARRETGLRVILFQLWLVFFLLCGGFCALGVMLSTPWMILGEFLTRTFFMVFGLPVLTKWVELNPGTRTRYFPSKPRGKKKRKRREHWFGRRQRARWRARPIKPVWGWADTSSDWLENWMRDNAYRFLHVSHYAKEFEQLSTANPDLMDILTGGTILSFLENRSQRVFDWGFLDVDGPLIDETQPDISVTGGRVLPSNLWHDGIRFQSVYFTNDTDLPIVFDTGASISVSPRESDFISWETKGHLHTHLNGISASTPVLGVGIVRWIIRDDRGRR